MRAAVRLGVVLGCLSAALGFSGSAAADVVDDNVAATLNAAGQVELFARGSDGNVYTRLAEDDVWHSLGGSASSGPAAMSRADGAVDVFVRGSDEQIYQRTRRGSTWSDWTSLGGLATSAPAAVERRGTGYIELFARASDNTLMHRYHRPGVGWSPSWLDMGGRIAAAPAVVSRIDGWADLFVRWSDNRLFLRFFDRARWSDWIVHDNQVNTLSAPSVTVPAEYRMEIFYRGLEKALWQRSFDGQSFGPVVKVDDQPLEGTPSAVADRTGRIRLYARSGEDVLVKTLAGSGWSKWSNMGPVRAPDANPGPGSGPQAPESAPAPAPPVTANDVELGTGLSCTPRGQRMPVSVSVRKRPGRAKPRVRKVVFYYRKGKGRVARTDRRAPYRRLLPVDLAPGTYRVYAKIHYKRPGKRKLGIKTVSRRFAVCA